MKDRSNILLVQCCYCLVFFQVKDARGAPGGVSHGICPKCYSELEKEWEKKIKHNGGRK